MKNDEYAQTASIKTVSLKSNKKMKIGILKNDEMIIGTMIDFDFNAEINIPTNNCWILNPRTIIIIIGINFSSRFINPKKL